MLGTYFAATLVACIQIVGENAHVGHSIVPVLRFVIEIYRGINHNDS